MRLNSIARRALFLLVLGLPAWALAQTPWPARPVTLVVPQSPGTAVDNMSRVIAKLLSARLGQAVIVDNKPGASGNIGAGIVANAAPDGYTLLVPANNLSIAPFVTKGLPWDPVRDFAPVAMPALAPLVLATHMDVNARTLAELIAMAKAQPEKLNYGSSGNGTPHHLAMTQLQQASGTKLFHVPFKSMGDLITGLLGGQVQVGFASPGNVLPHAKAGKLRLLAVSAPSRLPQMPDVPTLRELGLPQAESVVWLGLFAPAKTPPEIVARLSREVTALMQEPEYKDAMANIGFVIPSPGSAEQMAQQVRLDRTTLPPLLQAAGVSPSN